MNVHYEWASFRRLLEHSFFLSTAALFKIEEELGTPIHDSLHWSRRFEYPWVIQRLKDPGKLILDVGAGATALQFFLTREGMPTISLDIDKDAVEWINSRSTKSTAIVSDGTVKTVWSKPHAGIGSLPDLCLSANSFETCLCISVLEHLPKAQILPSIQELIRVAAKHVIITLDVALTRSQKQLDAVDLVELTKALDLPEIPMLPLDVLDFVIDGQRFGVLCMHLQK